MPNHPNHVFARREGEVACIQVEGRACAPQSPAVRRFAEQCLESGAATIQVDLHACDFLDSTFTGTLLALQQNSSSHGGDFVLVAPSPESMQALRQMHLDSLFHVEERRAAEQGDWRELESEPELRGNREFKRNVVDAHQALAHVKGPVGDRFRPLADAMEREWERERG